MKNTKTYTVKYTRHNPQLGIKYQYITGTLTELTEKLNISTSSRTIEALINKANNKKSVYGSNWYDHIQEGEYGYGMNFTERVA